MVKGTPGERRGPCPQPAGSGAALGSVKGNLDAKKDFEVGQGELGDGFSRPR